MLFITVKEKDIISTMTPQESMNLAKYYSIKTRKASSREHISDNCLVAPLNGYVDDTNRYRNYVVILIILSNFVEQGRLVGTQRLRV